MDSIIIQFSTGFALSSAAIAAFAEFEVMHRTAFDLIAAPVAADLIH